MIDALLLYGFLLAFNAALAVVNREYRWLCALSVFATALMFVRVLHTLAVAP